MNIIGKWEKITTAPCGQKYPVSIEFKPNGLYQAAASQDAAMHPLWDVGTFKLNKGKVYLSTSNDSIIAYKVHLEEKTLTITDSEGCELQFQLS